MNSGLLIAAVLVLTSAPAFARDARLVSRTYSPNEVVRIEGQTGVQVSIAFGDDEHIENVAIGDSTSWQVTPNKRANMLFIKPLNTRARTNMTVVTDQHKYFFDLVVKADARPLYVLQFVYPEKPSSAPVPASARLLTPDETLVLTNDPRAKPIDPASINEAWHQKGDVKLFPSRVYDDGQATYLSWPKAASIPAIQIRDEKGQEGPINFSVKDDVTIIDGVPTILILRNGKEMAILENRGKAKAARASAAVAEAESVSLKRGR